MIGILSFRCISGENFGPREGQVKANPSPWRRGKAVLGEDAGSLNSLWTVSRKIILFMSLQLVGWIIKLDEVKGSKV